MNCPKCKTALLPAQDGRRTLLFCFTCRKPYKADGAPERLSGRQKPPAEQAVKSELEALFIGLYRTRRMEQPELPELETEHYFCEERDYRLDFACTSRLVAVECQGVGHNTYSHFQRDCRKITLAARYGWRVLLCTTQMLTNEPDFFFDCLSDALTTHNSRAWKEPISL